VFRYLILGLLRDGAPRHGYALAKGYGERSGIDISTGNFYRELQRLVHEGLVRLVHNPPGADPRRTPYQITPTGSALLESWLFDPVELGEGQREDEISARALFLTEADAARVSPLVERWEEELWVRGKVLERARDAARAKGQSVLALLFSRRLKYAAADLEFLTQLRAAYEPRVGAQPERQAPPVVSVQPARAGHEPVLRTKPPRGRR
jgi:DNA-binding PadR family transcriptional regulator